MRLRSIPPRTMRTVSAGLTRPDVRGQPVGLRQTLVALQERLQNVVANDDRDVVPDPPSSGRKVGSAGFARRSHGVWPGSSHGRVYRRTDSPSRSVDILIPPRSSPGCRLPAADVSQTAEARVVSIVFPTQIRGEELRWEIYGDVLEVEYLGPAFAYYHAFMVPVETQPIVERRERTLVFRFPTGR